jgi:hypothetical protein
MTRRNLPAFGAVRISPDGEHLAWYRPESDRDPRPWLLLSEDSDALGVEHEWSASVDVAGWIPLESPAVTRADDALVAEVVAVVDPVPAGLAERVRRAGGVA